MSFLNFINPFNRVMDVVDAAVEDKDKANEIKKAISLAAETTYRLELQTKTVKWVDALHKMSRTIISLASIGAGVYLAQENAGLDVIAAAVAPGGIYNWVKGKGR